MTDDDKTALGIVGGIAAVVTGLVAWLLWPSDAKADDGKKAAVDEKKKAVFVPSEPVWSEKLCGLDGKPYDMSEFPDKSAVATALNTLGYAVSDVESAPGRDVVTAFQTRARSMGLDGMRGASAKWVDGIVGVCTLRALSHAMRLSRAGEWPSLLVSAKKAG